MKQSIFMKIFICAVIAMVSPSCQSQSDSHHDLNALAALFSTLKPSIAKSVSSEEPVPVTARCEVLCSEPSITSIIPVSAATEVGANSANPPAIVGITLSMVTIANVTSSSIAIAFNQAMLDSSLTLSSIVVTNADGQVVTGSLSYNLATYVATFTPANALMPYSTYYVNVDGSVVSATGLMLGPAFQSQFITGTTLVAATPANVSITPSMLAMGVATSSPITIAFHEAMLASSITPSNIIVTNVFGQAVAGSISYNPSTYVATFIPANALMPFSIYFVNVGANVLSSTGVALGSAFQSQFMTWF